MATTLQQVVREAFCEWCQYMEADKWWYNIGLNNTLSPVRNQSLSKPIRGPHYAVLGNNAFIDTYYRHCFPNVAMFANAIQLNKIVLQFIPSWMRQLLPTTKITYFHYSWYLAHFPLYANTYTLFIIHSNVLCDYMHIYIYIYIYAMFCLV